MSLLDNEDIRVNVQKLVDFYIEGSKTTLRKSERAALEMGIELVVNFLQNINDIANKEAKR